MERSKSDGPPRSTLERSSLFSRLAAGPISWGVCEVPGWGVMLPADRVLAEMASLGIAGTELGAPGFLPSEPDALRAVLDRHGLRLAGAFLPVVMHDAAEREASISAARTAAALLEAAGGDGVLVSTAVVDLAWTTRRPLSSAEWQHLFAMLAELDDVAATHGIVHALHPHTGTLVETREDVRSVLEGANVRWCLDTGHLLVGGYDPAVFAADASGRVVHVHLKDVRTDVAAAYTKGEVNLVEAVQRGLFCPLGQGDAPVLETVRRLEDDGYDGWYVLEQDTDLGPTEPVGAGPIDDVRLSVEFLHNELVSVSRASERSSRSR